ncbi:hypothetical protein EBT25_17970 [bacterium]|nr:hypothetical protein [bacterium]
MNTTQNYASVMPEQGLYPTGGVTNGRIDLMTPVKQPQWAQQEQQQGANKTFYREALYGRITRTPVSDMFFCPENINLLQDAIRYKAYKETELVIGRQSDQELKIIMTSVFFRYSRHVANDIVGQVRELNSHVIDYATKEVITNLKQYIAYRRDASTMPLPIDNPQLMGTKGTKTLEIKTFFT